MSIAYYPIKPVTYGAQIQFPNGAFFQDGYTTLTSSIGNGTTTPIPVVSTTGFLSAAGLIVEDEIILYTGKTANTFTGITRGALGTSSSAHASGLYISEAQPIVPPSTLIPVAITNTDTSNQVSIDPTYNSRVVFKIPGYYNIQFSAQILNYTTSDDDVTMWFRKNGSDIPFTAGIVTIPSKHGGRPGSTITSWNLVTSITAADQYLELMMTSDSGNSVVATYPPGVAPGVIHPASPSIILTATFVSALY